LADEDSEIEEIPKKKATKKKVKITKEGKTKAIKKSTPTKAKKKPNGKVQKSKVTKKPTIKEEKKKASKPNKKDGKAKKSKKVDLDDEEEGDLGDIDPDLILPGQKFPTPPEGDGTRIFYETLI
jgi:hypothetical protein